MTDLATLGIRINSAPVVGAANDLDKLSRAANDADRSARGFERSADASARSAGKFGASAEKASATLDFMKGALAGVATGIAAAFSGRAIGDAAKQFVDIQNSLRVAGLEGERLKTVYSELFAIGQRQGVGVGGLSSLFGGVSQVARELNASEADITRFTEGVAIALRVAGSDATQSAGALLQLRQALGSATIQAEEFNSMLDGARPVLQAVAAGLREADGSVSKLRDLVRDGQVSGEAFFRAFDAGRGVLENMARNAIPTLAQGSERLSNSFVDLTGKLDDALQISRTFGIWADEFSKWIDSTGAPAVVRWGQSFASFRDEVRKGNDGLREIRASLNSIGSWNGWGRLSSLMGGATTPQQMRDAGLTPIAEVPSSQIASLSGRPGFGGSGWSGRGRGSRSQVSLSDYPTGGTASSGGGGGGSSPAVAASINDEINAIARRTAALKNESNVIGLSTYATERNRVEFELRQSAIQKNIEITPELEARIASASEAFAQQTAKIEQQREKIEQQREAWRGTQDAVRFAGQSFTSFISDVVSGGRNASEAMMNLLKRLADVALQAVILGDGPLAGMFGTRGQNGNVGGLFGAIGSLFLPPGGAATAGPMNLIPSFDVGAWNIRNDGLAMIHKGETVLPVADAERFRSGRNDNKAPEVKININTPPGTSARTERREDSNGGFSIDVFIEQVESAIAGNVGSGRGSLAPAFEASYGMSRRGA